MAVVSCGQYRSEAKVCPSTNAIGALRGNDELFNGTLVTVGAA